MRLCMRGAAEIFNAVVYGDRRADVEIYRRMVEVDEKVTAAADQADLVPPTNRWPPDERAVDGCGAGVPAGWSGCSWSRAWWRRPSWSWSGTAGRRQADDPRSSTPGGAGALGALLAAEGVQVTTTDQVDEATAAAGPARTLVVANARPAGGGGRPPAAHRRLGPGDPAPPQHPDALTRSAYAPPGSPRLRDAGPRTARSRPRSAPAPSPSRDCGPATSRPDRPSSRCYPTADGHAYLGV